MCCNAVFRDIEDVSFDDSLPIERRGSLTSMISMTTTMTTDSSSSGGETARVSQGYVCWDVNYRYQSKLCVGYTKIGGWKQGSLILVFFLQNLFNFFFF
jgi:hypothetical protein